MAKNNKGAMAQYGSVIGPAVGLLIAVLLIVAVVVTDKVGEQRETLASATSQVQSRIKSTETDLGVPDLPKMDATAFAPRGSATVPTPAPKLSSYPVSWDIEIEAGGDAFDKLDTDKSGELSEEEWRRGEDWGKPGARGQFKNWDRDGSGEISRSEFENPPQGSGEQTFDGLKKNDDDVLKVEDGEINSKQLEEMDRNEDGAVSRDEYERWKKDGPLVRYGLVPVTDVTAVLDPTAFVVHVSWTAPSGFTAPPDMSYFIYRRAPATIKKRERDWSKKIEVLSAWETRRDEWLRKTARVNGKGEADPNGDADPQNRTWRQLLQREQWNSFYANGNNDPMPEVGPRPNEWEFVAGPITETEYNDRTFEPGVTYIYGVCAGTQETLRKGTKSEAETVPSGEKWNVSERAEQSGRPILVRTRVVMALGGASGNNSATIKLSRRALLGTGESAAWYQIIIEEQVASVPPAETGGVYGVAELKARNYQVLALDGGPGGEGMLPPDFSIDFKTGFTFVQNNSNGALMSSAMGDVLLPRETRNDPTVIPDPAGMENPIEVRMLAAKSGGSPAFFDVMRWHNINGKWYRVVLTTKAVETGKPVGRSVNLASPGDGVEIYDSADKLVRRNDDFAGQTVDLSAGAYEGLTGRTAKVGGKEFDIFATLYVE